MPHYYGTLQPYYNPNMPLNEDGYQVNPNQSKSESKIDPE